MTLLYISGNEDIERDLAEGSTFINNRTEETYALLETAYRVDGKNKTIQIIYNYKPRELLVNHQISGTTLQLET